MCCGHVLSAACDGSMEVYDPATGQWSEGPALSSARSKHSCTVLNGRLWVAGGFGAAGM